MRFGREAVNRPVGVVAKTTMGHEGRYSGLFGMRPAGK